MGNKNGIDDLLKKLKGFDNKLARQVSPQIEKLFQESVRFSIVDFYNSYDPQYYQRTNNFLNVSDHATAACNKNTITLNVSSEYMNSYPGFWGNKLDAANAFDMFFMKGEHGHGRWLMSRSIPPYLQVDSDVHSGFDGRMDLILNKSIKQILK